MQRRSFLTLFGGAAAAWPLAARAQPRPNRVWRIGSLAPVPVTSPQMGAFRQGLRDLGYVEGRNFTLEHREYVGGSDRLADLAAELVNLRVDVILALGSEVTRAVRQATSSIPIVMTSTNPLGLGFIASLARPGGNVTGLSLLGPEVSGKRLQLLKELVPGLRKVALFWNPDDPAAAFSLKETEVAAQTLGLEVQSLETRRVDAFAAAFEAAVGYRAQAVVLLPGPIVGMNRADVAELALKNRMPTMTMTDGLARAGGLASYGPSLAAVNHRAAYYVDRILKGDKPADLPVEQPIKFDFIINLKTAKALGLTVPPGMLALTDEVIE